jgi:hypothetical protein
MSDPEDDRPTSRETPDAKAKNELIRCPQCGAGRMYDQASCKICSGTGEVTREQFVQWYSRRSGHR